VPGYPWVPALFVLAAAYVVASAVAANPRNAVMGALLIGLGVPVYCYWAARAGGSIRR
jgi:basic amino acid/polyamine antiporter, APA family